MSFGFAVLRANGTVKISDNGGVATFGGVSAPNQPVSIHGIPHNWVWYAPAAFIGQEPVLYDFNLPSYLCQIQGDNIVFTFPSIYNPRLFWGLA